MIRDRRTILILLISDILVVAGTLFVMRERFMALRLDLPAVLSSSQYTSKSRTESPPSSAQQAAKMKKAALPQKEKGSSSGKTIVKKRRNIAFSFRNSRPAKVDIIASFTNWKPKAMKKSKNYTWVYTASLEPGSYTYNFVVDGRKIIRDPNNKRTAPGGRSLLTVKPMVKKR